jgi:hypothetical protein
MTDDIVVRLRELTSRVDNETLNRMWATNYDADTYLWLKDYETVRDATDEIERLRQERNYYKEMALHIAGKNFDANEEIHRLKLELKAVRGE